MKTKQLKVKLASGLAYLFVGDGCGEIEVKGFAPLAGVKELRERLQIEPQFLGAWDCKDGNAAIDYRVPVQSWYLHNDDKPTVRKIVSQLGRRWSDKMIADGDASNSNNYATI